MSIDMNLNMALPCRISVFTEKGNTQIGLIKPLQMLWSSLGMQVSSSCQRG
ncbi:MAG: hypothetical protein ACXWT4_18380 [Methylobacter sp.]